MLLLERSIYRGETAYAKTKQIADGLKGGKVDNRKEAEGRKVKPSDRKRARRNCLIEKRGRGDRIPYRRGNRQLKHGSCKKTASMGARGGGEAGKERSIRPNLNRVVPSDPAFKY